MKTQQQKGLSDQELVQKYEKGKFSLKKAVKTHDSYPTPVKRIKKTD